MESALTTSALPANKRTRRSVFPTAVGPKRRTEGGFVITAPSSSPEPYSSMRKETFFVRICLIAVETTFPIFSSISSSSVTVTCRSGESSHR
jgi:hypothetical protein